MKTFLNKIKARFSQNRNRLRVWKYRLLQGNYQTVAEKLISPHLRDAKLIFWFACAFSLMSIGYSAEAFERSGAVLVVAGIFLGQKISKARTASNLIKNGVVSPDGYLGSAHLPGQFLHEWNNENLSGAPIFFWLIGQDNLMLKLEVRMNCLLINGTVVWGYGSLIHKTFTVLSRSFFCLISV